MVGAERRPETKDQGDHHFTDGHHLRPPELKDFHRCLFGTVPTVWSDRCLKVFEESAIIATLAKKTRGDAPC